MDHLEDLETIASERNYPPPPEEGRLRVIPLGGLGEFGKNAMVLEYGRDMILIDCGQKFPEEEMFGIDLVIPDFSYVLANIDRLRGLVLTHGHEDHIGAIPYFIRQIPERRLPIYGPRLTLALVREKLSEMNLQNSAELIEIEGEQKYFIGHFEVEFIPVPHSFPMAMSLFIHLPIGTVIHTGDYKFDTDREGGGFIGSEHFERIGREGRVLLLMADSTNVGREGVSLTEEQVEQGLAPLFAAAPRTIVMATFSSNLKRVQTALDLAQETDRFVSICGFSLERNFAIATELGLLHYPGGLVLPLNELIHKPAHRRLILTTGTQGEPLSALSRLSLNSFKGYSVQKDDMVILSSRIIPGNERAIYRMINHFYRHGARVITERDAVVHGSGHAYRDEMRRLLNLTRPMWFMPVHGEMFHLYKHRELAQSCGIPEENIHILENGMLLEIDDRMSWFAEEADLSGQVLVDGRMIEGVEDVVLRDRKHLAEDGILTVILAIDKHSHKIISGPDIVSRGFVANESSEVLFEACRQRVIRAFEDCDVESQEEWDVVKTAVRKALRKYLRDEMDRYPMIVPVVVEI